MSAIQDLAKELNKNKNPHKIGVQVMHVVAVSPFKIEADRIHAEGKNLVIAAHLLKGYERRIALSTADGTVVYTEILQEDVLRVGDDVIVMASDNNQVFYVIDKAVRQ